MNNPFARPGRPASLALGALAFLVLGLTTRAEDEIPDVDQNVQAEIVDTSQTTTVGDHLSVDGTAYFSVLRGKMTIFVPFEKLRSVESTGKVKSDDGVDRVEATFTFQDGSTESGLLKARQTLYGVSKLGNFQLKLRDVRTIRFLAVGPKQSAARPS